MFYHHLAGVMMRKRELDGCLLFSLRCSAFWRRTYLGQRRASPEDLWTIFSLQTLLFWNLNVIMMNVDAWRSVFVVVSANTCYLQLNIIPSIWKDVISDLEPV